MTTEIQFFILLALLLALLSAYSAGRKDERAKIKRQERAAPAQDPELQNAVIKKATSAYQEEIEQLTCAANLFKAASDLQANKIKLMKFKLGWAKGLITQMPAEHEGAQSWLLNYDREWNVEEPSESQNFQPSFSDAEHF